MICCINCFKDNEIKASIEMLGHKGNCPICGKTETWIYDSTRDGNDSTIEDMLASIIEIYVPESELPYFYPEHNRKTIAHSLCEDWSIFSVSEEKVSEIVQEIVNNSLILSDKILRENVGIPQLYDEEYLQKNAIMRSHSWEEFKKSIRSENRFHNDYLNLEVLGELLGDAEVTMLSGELFYRARVANEKGKSGFTRNEMWAPPSDIATPGRANSRGQSCLYLSNKKETTVKEIRACAFDYVTIAHFKLNRNVKILDLCSITHNSPFYAETNKIDYLVNERTLGAIEEDLARPLSRSDSELEYLPTQYISDFARFCGYDGVRYYSTFDKNAYNIALFDSRVCSCTYHRTYVVGNLDYKLLVATKNDKRGC